MAIFSVVLCSGTYIQKYSGRRKSKERLGKDGVTNGGIKEGRHNASSLGKKRLKKVARIT